MEFLRHIDESLSSPLSLSIFITYVDQSMNFYKFLERDFYEKKKKRANGVNPTEDLKGS